MKRHLKADFFVLTSLLTIICVYFFYTFLFFRSIQFQLQEFSFQEDIIKMCRLEKELICFPPMRIGIPGVELHPW